MSQVNKYRCDLCGFEVRDRYSLAWWIHIEGSLSVSRGRTVRGSPDTGRFLSSGDADLCSLPCLLKWISVDPTRAGQLPTRSCCCRVDSRDCDHHRTTTTAVAV